MDIIIRPVVTEKMNKASEKLNRYGFIVEKTANKLEIKKAVESMYGVGVTEVNTMLYSGKSKGRFTKRGFVEGRKNDYKKAVVTLVDGDTIDFFSNI